MINCAALKVNLWIYRLLLIAAVVQALVSCSNRAPAPVLDLSARSQPGLAADLAPEFYQVAKGDTLYSIAWRYSLDHNELAEFNQLKNNLIYPGQKLRLNSNNPKRYFDEQKLIAALFEEVLNKPVNEIKNISSSHQAGLDKKSKKTKNTYKNKQLNKKKPQNVKREAVLTSAKKRSKNEIKWIWPANGDLLTRFSARQNEAKGIVISGKPGDPVRAVAPGQVVYGGSGLRGYGNLVIIKHSDDYLSAYAHNEKIHVVENELVDVGQRIADLGSSGTNSPKLHFEIRYRGKPVDPLNYLPGR